MLRLLLGANQPCSLLHYGPFETGGRDGCCPRCLLPDKEASLLLLFTTDEIGRRGWSCTNRDRLMKPIRALALPAVFKMVWRHGNAPCGLQER